MELNKNLYKGYAVAMRKNGCKPTPFGRLSWHLEREEVEFFSFRSAWIAGQHEGEFFFPSHVGYNSLRDLVELLDWFLLEAREKVILAVLPNMGGQLERLGWLSIGEVWVDYPYRQLKRLYTNSFESEYTEEILPDWEEGDQWDGEVKFISPRKTGWRG